MSGEEAKKAIELIKKSKEEIGEKKYNELAKEVDDDLKEKLGEEKYQVWVAANGNEEDEQKLIKEIGEEKYSKLLSEITNELSEDLK